MNSAITPELLDEIERKALGATQGAWMSQPIVADGDERGCACIVGADLQGLIGAALPFPTELDSNDFARVKGNAAHIARMDPPTTLALVARIRVMEAAAVQMAEALKAVIDADPCVGRCELTAKDGTCTCEKVFSAIAVYRALKGKEALA